MRQGFMVGILGILLAAPAAAQQVEVTLQEALRRALDVQPAMVQARGDQSNAGASMRASIGSYLHGVKYQRRGARRHPPD